MSLNLRITGITLLLFATACSGQQVTVAMPNYAANDSFYENFGLRFGFQYDGATSQLYFRNTGGTPPVFGGFDPNSQANFGVGGRRGNWSWSLGATAGQGSSQNRFVTTPILTLPSGGFGYIQSVAVRPFVLGVIPVVNNQTMVNSQTLHKQQLEERFARAVRLVAEAKSRKQKEYAELQRQVRGSGLRKRSAGYQLDEPLVLRPKREPTAEQLPR